MSNSIKEYMSIKSIAELTGVNERTLRRRCESMKYQSRKIKTAGGQSGYKYEILTSSLEKNLQKIILRDVCYEGNTSSNVSVLNKSVPLSLDFKRTPIDIEGKKIQNNSHTSALFSFDNKPIPESAKELALAKYDVIKYWQDYRKDKDDKKKADNEFILGFNAGLISDTILKKTGSISKPTLYRWKKLLNENNNSYYALINNYRYASSLDINTTLTDSEIQEFAKIYYNDSKYHFDTAYSLIKYIKEQKGENIKSKSTYRRYIKNVARLHNDIDVLAREGEKALNDKVGLVIHRDISDLKVGDVLVADGNKLDFFVINPYTGRPCRAIMVVYLDWVSFDIAGYEIMLSENTQCIASALRNSILRLGKMPQKVYMDNGKAFRGEYFTGTTNFKDIGFSGIYKNLGIELIIANAYSGRSKVVERFFRNFVQSCPPAISSYIGNNIENRPAHLKRNEKFHKELHNNDKIPTLDETKLIIESWLNYYRSTTCPHCKSMSVGEAFNAGKGSGIDEDLLNELLMASKERVVKRGEISIFGLKYQSPKLYGLSDKVIVKYSMFDLSKIKVFTMNGEYICDAETIKLIKAVASDGSAIDLYNFKMQLKRNKNLISNTIKKTKLIVNSSIPFEEASWSNIAQLSNNDMKIATKCNQKLIINNYEGLH